MVTDKVGKVGILICCRRSIERDEFYMRAYLRGGDASLNLKRPSDALEFFNSALVLDPASRRAMVSVALKSENIGVW